MARRRVAVAHEIALALELYRTGRIGFGDGGLDPRVGENLERLRVEIGGEIGGVRRRIEEQLIVDADFGRYRLRRRQPMHGRLDLASVRRVATFGRGIIGTV